MLRKQAPLAYTVWEKCTPYTWSLLLPLPACYWGYNAETNWLLSLLEMALVGRVCMPQQNDKLASMQESFSWRHLCKFRDALNVIIFPILCMWWQIMDAHGNYQPRKEISLKSIPSTRRDFFSTWTLNCEPVCFSNSLSQHAVVNKEKVILWWHLNSGSASASWGASVHYKPLRQ